MPQEFEDSLPTVGPVTDQPVPATFQSEVGERTRKLDTAVALELLASGHCPACAFVEERENKFFLWFGLEHYLDFGTIERLDASLGFCPRHCRTLLRLRFYPGTLTHVYRHVVQAACARLEAKEGGGECIGCAQERWASGHAIDLVLRSLSDSAVARAYAASYAFCASHFLKALSRGTRKLAGQTYPAFAAALVSKVQAVGLVEIFTSLDPDAGVRATYLKKLPTHPLERSSTTVEYLLALLSVDSCPCCLAAGLSVRGYLQWIASENATGSTDLGREVVGLCGAHMADLVGFDAGAAGWLAEQKCAVWGGVFQRFAARELAIKHNAPPPEGRPLDRKEWEGILLDWIRRVLAPQREWLRRVDAAAKELPTCGACRAAQTAVDRTASLLSASFADSSLAAAYERSHGLCVQHVLGLPPGDRALPLQVCNARLKLLAWELEEAGRKLDWLVRYERRGDESTAWKRTMAQIDGRVFLGGSPSVDPFG
jgi:hypothetical protein